MRKVKIIANYLPQYHEIEENNIWWGKGFTDWVTVKNAEPLFPGHIQPQKPLNDNYYDLSDMNSIKWQAQIARGYGIYGFGIYHYWFSSQKHLMEKPAAIILGNKDINIHYLFIWDNVSFRRTWSSAKFANAWAPKMDEKIKNNGCELLLELQYGNKKDWKIHFDYLLPYFDDTRYIKIDGMPLFGIFNQDNDSFTLKEMFSYWNELAKENGYKGICILGKKNASKTVIADREFLYQPHWDGWTPRRMTERFYAMMKRKLKIKHSKAQIYDYDDIWRRIILYAEQSKDSSLMYGGFVDYDDTPRRGARGIMLRGASPQKFHGYLQRLVEISSMQDKEYIFLTAWNEWGEGAHLEPDETNRYGYLEAIRNIVFQF